MKSTCKYIAEQQFSTLDKINGKSTMFPNDCDDSHTPIPHKNEYIQHKDI